MPVEPGPKMLGMAKMSFGLVGLKKKQLKVKERGMIQGLRQGEREGERERERERKREGEREEERERERE